MNGAQKLNMGSKTNPQIKRFAIYLLLFLEVVERSGHRIREQLRSAERKMTPFSNARNTGFGMPVTATGFKYLTERGRAGRASRNFSFYSLFFSQRKNLGAVKGLNGERRFWQNTVKLRPTWRPYVSESHREQGGCTSPLESPRVQRAGPQESYGSVSHYRKESRRTCHRPVFARFIPVPLKGEALGLL